MPNDNQPTPHFFPVPSVMLVGLSPKAQDEIVPGLAPLTVLKVAHVAAACERMISTRPLVVVLESRPKEAELEALRATAQDIGAQVVLLADYPDDPERWRSELVDAKRLAVAQRLDGSV